MTTSQVTVLNSMFFFLIQITWWHEIDEIIFRSLKKINESTVDLSLFVCVCLRFFFMLLYDNYASLLLHAAQRFAKK